MKEADLDRAADLATRNPYFNPRPVNRESIRRLLDDAYFGRRPEPRAYATHTDSLIRGFRRAWFRAGEEESVLTEGENEMGNNQKLEPKRISAGSSDRVGRSGLGRPPVLCGGEADQDWLRQPENGSARAVCGGGSVRYRRDVEAIRRRRHNCRRQDARRDPGARQPVEAEPGGRGRGVADQGRRGRSDPRVVDAGDDQSRQRPVRAQRGALHLDRRALAALVLHSRRQTRNRFQLDLPLLLGPRGHHRRLRRDVGKRPDQQGHRRPLAE